MNLEANNPNWKIIFKEEKKDLNNIFCDEALKIEHIGSTAISNIKSKPIIDIAILLKSFESLDKYLKKLKELNYKHDEKRSSSERCFLTKTNPTNFHLSLANPATSFFDRQIFFRNYLNKHQDVAKDYEKLKEELIKKYPSGNNEYSYGKSNFIAEILNIA